MYLCGDVAFAASAGMQFARSQPGVVLVVWGGSVLDEDAEALHLLVLGGVVDGALAVAVEQQARAVPQQPAHRLHVAPRRGEVQRSGAVAVPQVRVHVLILHLKSTKLCSMHFYFTSQRGAWCLFSRKSH